MNKRFKAGKFTVTAGEAVSIADDSAPAEGITPAQTRSARRVGAMIKAYLKAAHGLLDGQYAHVKDQAPAHFAHPARAIAISCDDGVLVRYEGSTDHDQVFSGYSTESIVQVARGLSESVILCVEAGVEPDAAAFASAPKVQLVAQSPAGEERLVHEFGIQLRCTIESSTPKPVTPFGQPFRILGAQNEFELSLILESVGTDRADGERRQFVTRSTMRLPVGWHYIEIYPAVDAKYWNKELAHSWAERDILAAVMSKQHRDRQYLELDPNAAARRDFAKRFDEYSALLNSDPKEELLQEFLTRNPSLLSPTHSALWPKLKLGKRVTDFVFREADGEYLMVELEKPSKRLFVKSGDTSSDLTHARDQITDWKRYIEDNLRTVQNEVGLAGISADPRGLIVIGRSAALSVDDRRKLVTLQNETPKVKIMTYDDVLDSAKAAVENVLGPLWTTTGSAEVYMLPLSLHSAQPPQAAST